MVIYLHSADDAQAGDDLKRIYDTRTLGAVHSVNRGNRRTTLSAALDSHMLVVVPEEATRICDTLLTVLRCLKLMDKRLTTVREYLHMLENPAAPASAQVHAHADGSGAASGIHTLLGAG